MKVQLNVGDKVMLLSSSVFYSQAPNLIGTVKIVVSDYWCRVQWPNRHYNGYAYNPHGYVSVDVVVVEQKPIKITMRRKTTGEDCVGL